MDPLESNVEYDSVMVFVVVVVIVVVVVFIVALLSNYDNYTVIVFFIIVIKIGDLADELGVSVQEIIEVFITITIYNNKKYI